MAKKRTWFRWAIDLLLNITIGLVWALIAGLFNHVVLIIGHIRDYPSKKKETIIQDEELPYVSEYESYDNIPADEKE